MIGGVEVAAVATEADDGGVGGFGVAGKGEDDSDTAVGCGIDFEFFAESQEEAERIADDMDMILIGAVEMTFELVLDRHTVH